MKPRSLEQRGREEGGRKNERGRAIGKNFHVGKMEEEWRGWE